MWRSIFVVVFFVGLMLHNDVAFSQGCYCTAETRSELAKNNRSGTIEKFAENLHHNYQYVGGGFAGKTVFDLSKDEIRKAYRLMDGLSRDEFLIHKDYYESGISELKTSEVRKSATYDKDKANLIFALDKQLHANLEAKENNLRTDLNSSRVAELNYNNNSFTVIEVEVTKPGIYRATDGSEKPIYTGPNISDLVKKVNTRLSGKPNAHSIYFDVKANSIDKANAFITSYRIRQQQTRSDINVNMLPRFSQDTEIRDSLLLGSAHIEKSSPIEIVKEGSYKGWYRATVGFIATVEDRVHRFVINISSKSREIVQDFLNTLTSLSNTNAETKALHITDKSIAHLLTQARQQLATNYQGNAFLVTGKSLATLKKQKVPESTLSKVQQFSEKTFKTRATCEQTLRQKIGDAEFDQYGSKILKAMEIDMNDALKIQILDETGSLTLGMLLAPENG